MTWPVTGKSNLPIIGVNIRSIRGTGRNTNVRGLKFSSNRRIRLNINRGTKMSSLIVE